MREMFKKADLIDLYSLADPERCKRYIVVAADALDELFAKINLNPAAGKEGVIYFQTIEGIRADHPRPAEQKKYCQELAIFFIRIFQIYAALALSILDNDLPSIDPREFTAATGTGDRAFIRPRLMGRPPLKGGALTQRDGGFYLTPERAGNYTLLNRYLLKPVDGYFSDKPLQFRGFELYIPQNSLYSDVDSTTQRRTKSLGQGGAFPVVICKIYHLDETYTLTGELAINRAEMRNFRVQLRNIRTVAKPGETFKGPISGTLIERYSDDPEPQTEKGETMPYLLLELFTEAFEKLVKPPFSAVSFLLKHKIIRSIDTPLAVIEGARAVIPQAPKEFLRANRIPIQYQDKISSGGAGAAAGARQIDIKINVDLKIERHERKFVSEQQKYTISLIYDNLSTSPADLKSYLEYGSKNEATFFTGGFDTSVPRTERGGTIGQFIQAVFEKMLKPLREKGPDALARNRVQYTREGYVKPYDSAAIPEHLRIKRIWEGLVRSPPLKAHCVARAVQLLSLAAIKGAATSRVYSDACSLRFPYLEDGTLPKTGASITTSLSISALANLFIEKVVGGVPRIYNQPQVKEQMARLKQFFEGYEDVEDVPSELASFKEIRSSRPEECTAAGQLVIPKDKIAGLRTYVRDLLNRQAAHMRNVMSVLFMLFNESQLRKGDLELHPRVGTGGMQYLNEVAAKAREVLVDYYSGCEEIYRKGVGSLKGIAVVVEEQGRGQGQRGQQPGLQGNLAENDDSLGL